MLVDKTISRGLQKILEELHLICVSVVKLHTLLKLKGFGNVIKIRHSASAPTILQKPEIVSKTLMFHQILSGVYLPGGTPSSQGYCGRSALSYKAAGLPDDGV